MKTDLYLNKEEALLDWCRHQGFFSKKDVMQYGIDNFYLRADRTIRTFVQQGKVRKLNEAQCRAYNFRGRMAWYCFVRE